MATNSGSTAYRINPIPPGTPRPRADEPADARTLLDAFQMFTHASSSLETAFRQLEARTQSLSEELSAKNRQLRKSLREKATVQNYLRRILESLPCGVLVLGEDGAVTLCNPVAAQIIGEGPGRPGAGLDGARRAGGRGMQEYLRATSIIRMGGKEVEIPLVLGGKMRTIAISVIPLTGASGARIGSLHILRDITEIKALQEQSKRGERLSAMGEMAVELAHEIRNPLGSIELFASLLEQELPRASDPGRWAENIRIGSRSLNNIVSNMLQFANPLSPAFRDVEMHGLIEETLRFTEPILRQREISVEKDLAAGEPSILGDRELLKQMLLNLVLNSLQAMPSQGRLRLCTRDVDRLPGGASCTGLELRVEDTGLGIPAEYLDRIFDPFFTTNKNGTGLGLSVVHQIVDQHSGFITVGSEVNVGTIFTVVLPNVRLAAAASERADRCPSTF